MIECLDYETFQKGHSRPKRPCLYCGTMQSQLARHLKRKHADEDDVSKAITLPLKEQNEVLARIRKSAILNVNTKRLRESKSEEKPLLITERYRGNEDVVMCGHCTGFYKKSILWKHTLKCQGGQSQRSVPVPTSALAISDEIRKKLGPDFTENILNRFHEDDIGNLCKTDKLILLVGRNLHAKGKKRKITMTDMRRLGTLLHTIQKKQGTSFTGADILHPKQFPALEEALESLSKTEDGNLKAGLNLGIGYLLKKSIKVMKGHYIIEGAAQKVADVDNFAAVLDLNWDYLFAMSQQKIDGRRQDVLRKPKVLPLESDVEILKLYVTQRMDYLLNDQYHLWTESDFTELRALVVCRLTLFNARRGGEPAKLTLSEWNDADTQAWIDPQMVETVEDPIEKALLAKYKLAYQMGKGLKLVPVLIPHDTIPAIEKLVKERVNAGASKSNKYLFPTTTGKETHVEGWPCVESVSKRACLQKPSLITATHFRHRASTYYALQDATEADRKIFYRHMGHAPEVNQNVYQCPLAIREVCSVGKYLEKIDGTRGIIFIYNYLLILCCIFSHCCHVP